jgi:putative ABC transport system permease protein
LYNNLLWRKIMRDFWIARGRILMMMIAISAGIFAVSTILSAYTILEHEISRNYLGTHPASAQLEMEQVDDALVDKVRHRPGIADAEGSSIITARIEKGPDEWTPLLLFVIKNFNTMRINTFKPEAGAWPPPKGTILLEKEALALVHAKIGDAHRVKTLNGPAHNVVIAGLVHDPGLPPAWQEQTAYGYITSETQAWLGEGSTLHILKVTVRKNPFSMNSVEKTVAELAVWLNRQGYKVESIRIPPPGLHPHQSQMDSILLLLLIFSFLALLLSVILMATLIGGLLAGQVRQIGIMKSIGARSSQVAGAYIMMVIVISTIALIVGLPLGIHSGESFAKIVAGLLNLKIYSLVIPGWIYLVLVLFGILVPFQMAYRPILLNSRLTVREAINDFGVRGNRFGSRRLDILLGKIKGIDRTLILTLRNTFRRRDRLLLTLGLLAAAGGMFMTSLNVKTSWERYIRGAAIYRHYDLEINLNHFEPEQKILQTIANIPGVRKVESWNTAPAAVYRRDGLDITRTYPDGGHGSFTLRSVPPGSKMFRPPLLSGRWLKPGDINAVVLNHMVYAFYPNIKTGERLTLVADGHPIHLKVVGITKEILTAATAYVSPDDFAKVSGQMGQSNTIRVAVYGHDMDKINNITRDIEHQLEKEGVSVNKVVPESFLDGALNGHIYIFILALILMAMVMAVVGTLGLMSSMSVNVIERTREFGVMRTIGGKSSVVICNVIVEGIFIAIISWVIGIILSIPLSAGIDSLIGKMSFRLPLPIILAPFSISLWLFIVVCCVIVASFYPALKASRLTVRETLLYL